ncbi:MAG TPA: GNAT family N-acetyltransferase [Pyrinomonadaceae bacterium]|jgi:ribosomal-protein-alanine N-acetyltransferase
MADETKSILETERLILRSWKVADSKALFEICQNAEVMLHIGNGKPYETVADAVKFLEWAADYQNENGYCRWAVIEKSSGKIVGSSGFSRLRNEEIELGYLFAREVWGNGLATEAARACLKYGFEKLNFNRIVALTDVEHTTSQQVLKKIGFIERGIEKNGDEEDLVYEAVNPFLAQK